MSESYDPNRLSAPDGWAEERFAPSSGQGQPEQTAPGSYQRTYTRPVYAQAAHYSDAGQGAHSGYASAGAQVPPARNASPFASPTGGAGSSSYASGRAGTPSFPQRSSLQRPVKKGPGWVALGAGMLVSALVSVTAVFGIWGAQSPFSESANMTSGQETSLDAQNLQSSSATVKPVNSEGTVPDWEAVAAAVRPATVTIQVSGESGSASGSGVIIDKEGHIITNHHVVSGVVNGGSIQVALHDGRLYTAEIVGTDQTTDLAVLALNEPPSDLTAALLGDSSTLKVGQPVMAIGAPLGLADTVTTGIVSALDRPVSVQADADAATQQAEIVVTNAIQIDASINPGNSGGPLFDSEGAVVGINSSIASMESGQGNAGSIGLGFAIPANLASSVASQILETGVARHALLGVQIGTVSVASGGEQRLGAQVAAVTDGGAAHNAGIAVGDVIIGIDGNSVTSGSSLTGYVRRYTAGDEVTLDVIRDGETMQMPVILQEK